MNAEMRCAWCDKENGILEPHADHGICNYHRFVVIRTAQEEAGRAILERQAEALLRPLLCLIAERSAAL